MSTPPAPPLARPRTPGFARAALGSVALLAGVLALYVAMFHTLAGFTRALDHGRTLFRDFISFFYPMGTTVLTTRAPVLGYLYSPFFALVLHPLALLPLETAIVVWAVVEVLVTALLFALPVPSLFRAKHAVAWYLAYLAVFLTSFPVLHNFRWGQVSALITLLTLAAVYAYRAGRARQAGLLLAVAASVKLYPALLLLTFVARRERRPLLVVFVVVALLMGILPALVLGPEETVRFYVVVYRMVSGSVWIGHDTNSQYVGSVVARLTSIPATRAVGGWAGAVIVLADGWAVWRLARTASADDAVMWGAALVFLSLPFALETSWPHYFVYLPFVQLLVARTVAVLPGANLARVGVALSIGLASVFGFALFPGWEAYSRAGCLFFADAVLLVVTWAHLWPRIALRPSTA